MGYCVRAIDHKTGCAASTLFQDVKVLLQAEPEPVIFDVGANEGQTIGLLQETFQAPRIYAFEPSPPTYERLRAAHGARSGIRLKMLPSARRINCPLQRDHAPQRE